MPKLLFFLRRSGSTSKEYAQELMESMRSLCPRARESKFCYYSLEMFGFL